VISFFGGGGELFLEVLTAMLMPGKTRLEKASDSSSVLERNLVEFFIQPSDVS